MKLSYFGIVSESSLPPQSAAPAAQTRLHSILPDATFPTFCPGYIFWCSDGEIFSLAAFFGVPVVKYFSTIFYMSIETQEDFLPVISA